MLLRSALTATLLAIAPLQCGHTPDVELREDETPGDALWALSLRLRAAHDEAGARQALEFLIERYPASRWAPAARAELEKASAPGPVDGAAAP